MWLGKPAARRPTWCKQLPCRLQGAVADIPVLNDPARFAPPVAAPTNWPTDASFRKSMLRAFPHLRPTPEMTWAALYARSLHRQLADDIDGSSGFVVGPLVDGNKIFICVQRYRATVHGVKGFIRAQDNGKDKVCMLELSLPLECSSSRSFVEEYYGPTHAGTLKLDDRKGRLVHIAWDQRSVRRGSITGKPKVLWTLQPGRQPKQVWAIAN